MNLSEIEITEVSAHYGETKSLPDYSNVKPGYSLKAVVKPGQDPEEVKAALAEQVRAWVWEDCDTALEREGRRAEFWTGPRYDALSVREDKYIAIVPHGVELPGLWVKANRVEEEWRYEALLKVVQREYKDWTVADFSFEENLDALPDLKEFQVIWLNSNGTLYCLILPYEFDDNLLPETWRSRRYAEHRWYTRLAANFLPWITEQAQSKEAILINALDGDLSKLPDLAPKEPVEQAIADGFIPDIHDDDEDDEDDEDFDDDDDDDEDEPSF